MIQIVFRVLLAAVWLVIGLGMLTRTLLPANMLEGRDALTLNLMGLIALVLAAYNALRLVAYLRRQRARARLAAANPLATPRPDAPPRERQYIPELDFTDRGPPADPKPDDGRPA